MANTPQIEDRAEAASEDGMIPVASPTSESPWLIPEHVAHEEPPVGAETGVLRMDDAGTAVPDSQEVGAVGASAEPQATREDMVVEAADAAGANGAPETVDEAREEGGTETSDGAREVVAADAPDGAGAEGGSEALDGDEVVTPAVLVDTLVAAAAPRRNRRRQPERSNGAGVEPHLPPHREAAGATSTVLPEEPEPPLVSDAIPEDTLDDRDWRDRWPDNEVRIVGQLLPRISEAPPLDGVQRVRMELSLVEQHDGAFGSVGTLPLFVMPRAPGFGPIYRELLRTRRLRRRIEPITVELQGVLRQMPDRDLRYATERYSVRMGVEVHQLWRVPGDTEQLAYWRGRVTVTGFRRYTYKGLPFRRVTGVVAYTQRKPHLRGLSVTHIPVDFLVAPDHEHADRFRRAGQCLLVEANISGDVYRMNTDHPDLEGIDDPRRRAQLQILRESVVTVTLGEFPDEAAEEEYEKWVKAGRPFPASQAQQARLSRPPHANTETGLELRNGAETPAHVRDRKRNGHGGGQGARREASNGTVLAGAGESG